MIWTKKRINAVFVAYLIKTLPRVKLKHTVAYSYYFFALNVRTCNGRFFNFGSRKKNMLTPSPKPKRRGSSNSGDGDGETTVGPVAHHSYSTGNLQELDDKAVVLRSVCLSVLV